MGDGSPRDFGDSPEHLVAVQAVPVGTSGGRLLPAAMGAGLLAALLVGPAAVFGAEPIRGAFGVELGAAITGVARLPRAGSDPVGGAIGFTPAEPAPGFEEYILEATPLTHTIYVVAGRGTVASLSRCLKTRTQIATQMTRRHGAPESSDNSITAVFGQDPSLVGRQGGRTIRVECDMGPEGSRITLEYRDEDVEALARQERETLGKEKRLTTSAK